MPSNETTRVREIWSELLAALAPPAGIPEYREGWNAMCGDFPIPEGTVIESSERGGVPVLIVTAPGADPSTTILWAHGGGYVFGSVVSYRAFASALSAASGSQIVLPDYRQAPESSYPAAHDDVDRVYRALLDEGRSPSSIVLGGDSAGGGLTAGVLLRLKDAGAPIPAGLIAVSPIADFTFAGESMVSRAEIDPIGSRPMLEGLAGLYRADVSATEPYLSPIFGDWAGAPPLLVLVGSDEVLFDDAKRLADAAKEAGVTSRLIVGEGQAHVWPIFHSFLPEGRVAVEDLGAFVRQVTDVA